MYLYKNNGSQISREPLLLTALFIACLVSILKENLL